jgi:CubicO group peptidase (beta-lactamase class C family)
MRHAKLGAALLLALLTQVACTTVPSDALDTACDSAGCISLKKFAANIDTELNGKVVGYISLVGPLGIITTYGQARTAADPPARPMDQFIPTNVASISKVLTTVGVLQSLSKHSLSLDSKVAPFLPSDWTLGANVDTISFRELLTHRAGIRSGAIDYDGMKLAIAGGVTLADKSMASYSNMNFALFRVLLPYMEGFSDPGPTTRPTATANFYVDYMRQNVFQPVGITNANCKPPFGIDPMLSYPPPPVGPTHGTDWSDWTLICGGGGWVLSVDNLYRILLSLDSGTSLLSEAQRTLMASNCLGWDCSVQMQTDFVGKNGLLPDPNGSGRVWLWTFFGIFKGFVPVVVVVNSDTPGTANITDIVVSAFANATVPHP